MSVEEITTHTARVSVEREEGLICGSQMDGSLYVWATSKKSTADAKAAIRRFARAVLQALGEDE